MISNNMYMNDVSENKAEMSTTLKVGTRGLASQQ